LGPAASGFGGGGTTGGFDFNVEDIFGGLFGGGSRARRRPSPGAGPQRGTDVEANLHLSFNEAVEGAVTTVNVNTPIPCSTCGGSGSKPGTMPVVCPRCGGAGVINDNQGLFSLSTPCPECRGRGTKVVDPCPTCFGTGQQRRERKVKVRIPAGVADGQRIKVKGHGEPGRNGGPNGDLYVTVDVAPHPLFGRRGADLTLTVPVTFAEAALGAEITVPSLDQPVTLRLPPGTSSGKRFRVAGKGLHHISKHGDLLVTVEVVVPAEVTPEQREAIDALAKATPTSPRSYLGV
jgi:molecular chaperone DnaJ